MNTGVVDMRDVGCGDGIKRAFLDVTSIGSSTALSWRACGTYVG
jgi:hypothetical protein